MHTHMYIHLKKKKRIRGERLRVKSKEQGRIQYDSVGTNSNRGWEKVRALRIWTSARVYNSSSDTDGLGKLESTERKLNLTSL